MGSGIVFYFSGQNIQRGAESRNAMQWWFFVFTEKTSRVAPLDMAG
jgi:hypothetical protein